jgi:hypothetical protein
VVLFVSINNFFRPPNHITGNPIFLDLGKATGAKRVRGQGKEFTAVYFDRNVEPFEVMESPEELLGIKDKLGEI